MKYSIIKLLLLHFFFAFAILQPSFAQEDKKIEKAAIKTKDGNFYAGEVIVHFADRITIKDREIGEITLYFKDIRKVKYFKEQPNQSPSIPFVKGDFWHDNPIYSFSILGSNAFSLKKGKWVYQNTMFLYNSFAYGFSENFSVNFGTFIPIPIFDETIVSFLINPKFTIPIDGGFSIGFGNGFAFANGGWIDFPYIVGTVGSKNRHLSLSMGYGISSFDGVSDAPIVSFSGLYRISNSVALITENWYTFFENEAFTNSSVFTYGVRFIFKNTVLDLGLANNSELSEVLIIGFPFLHTATSFGKR